MLEWPEWLNKEFWVMIMQNRGFDKGIAHIRKTYGTKEANEATRYLSSIYEGL